MFHARRTLFAVTVPCCNDCDGGRLSLSLRCRNGAPSLPPSVHPLLPQKRTAGAIPTASDNLRTMRDRPSLPSPPSIVGLLRSDAPSSSNPNFATGDDVPPFRRVPRPPSGSVIPPRRPSRPSLPPRVGATCMMHARGGQVEVRTGDNNTRIYILVIVVSALQHPFWIRTRGILPAYLNLVLNRAPPVRPWNHRIIISKLATLTFETVD